MYKDCGNINDLAVGCTITNIHQTHNKYFPRLNIVAEHKYHGFFSHCSQVMQYHRLLRYYSFGVVKGGGTRHAVSHNEFNPLYVVYFMYMKSK